MVEQNARIALDVANRATVLEVGRVAVEGTADRAARRRVRPPELPGVLDAMADFLQQVVSGLASGGIYASLALALVLIHRATGVINFAQGEMAMFTTYIPWTLTANHGWPYWPAFVVTLLFAFVGGVGRPPGRHPAGRARLGADDRDRHDRPAAHPERRSDLDLDGEVRAVESPFPTRTIDIGGVAISLPDIGTIAVSIGVVVLLWPFFRFTKVGLALRASAVNPLESRPRRRAGQLDARPRLGARGGARRGERDAGGADGLPRPEHDAGDPDLRLRGRRARRHRLAGRRRGGRPAARRRPEPARPVTSTSSAPTCGCRRRS